MKKNLLSLIFGLFPVFSFFNANAQTTVTVDGSGTWFGYMNVFDQAMNYQFGSAWGLSDVKSTVNASGNTVTLQPNFNTYANAATAADTAYWHNGPIGNKLMEANTYLESTTIPSGPLTFQGVVASNTLAAGYTETAFIKVLDPGNGYATILNQTAPLPVSGPFSVTATIPATPGLLVQYGFTVFGLNANPVDEPILGNVLVGQATPLPLDLLNFNGKHSQGKVDLQWNTADEVNVDQFEIQKSVDGVSFTTFHKVQAQNNASNTYFATDIDVISDQYYRLRMNDMDGKISFSKTIRIVMNNNQSTSVFPNPATDIVTISASKGALKNSDVYNMHGTKVMSIKTSEASTLIDISSLPIGTYIIQLSDGQSMSFIKK